MRKCHSNVIEMKVNVLVALPTAAFTWTVKFTEETIMLHRSLTELTNGSGIGIPLSYSISRVGW